MQESIFKATIRRFFLILATVMGILVTFVLFSSLSSYFSSPDSSLEIKYSLTPEIQPNAQGARKILSDTAPVILKINIEGIIGTETLNRQTIAQQLMESDGKTLEGRIKGILLSINSPGGGATDSDSIYNALKDYKKRNRIPIYAHIDGLCASGGLYIACAADKIFATSASIIGSVGVVTVPVLNFSSLLEKVGIESKTLSAGKGKDELNPFRPWTKDEGANYQMIINDSYNQFVDIVLSNRPRVNRENLINVYGANVFPAKQSLEIGYVDASGTTYDESLAFLAKELGLKEDEYQVIALNKENWLQSLFRQQLTPALLTGKITHTIELQGQIPDRLINQLLYLHIPN